MNTNRTFRSALLLPLLFLAVTTIAGGLGILLGWIPLPLEWLAGSHFADYTIPGLSLLFIVGGLASVATVTVWRRHPLGLPVALAAGGAMMIYEIVEFSVIGWHWLQGFYFGVGLLIAALAGWLWLIQQRGFRQSMAQP